MLTSFTHPDLGPDQIADALAASGFELDAPRAATTTLLDTFDGRLHDAGLRLVHHDDLEPVLVLSGPGDSPSAHLAWTGPPPRLGPDLPPGPFGSRIAGPVAERALLPAAAVVSSRRNGTSRDRRGKSVVHVTVHGHPKLTDAPDVALPASIVVVHGVLGHQGAFDRAASALRELGLDAHDGDVLDVALDAAGRTAAGFSSSPTVPLDPSDDALTAVRAVLRNLLASLDANLAGTLDDLDPEFLHELRVAVRRTRSVLTETKKVLPSEVRRRARQGFGELGVATGRTRDLDVYVLGWEELISTLEPDERAALAPLRDALEADRLTAHAAMAEVLTSDATRDLLGWWQDWLDDPDVVAEGRQRSIGPFVAERIHLAQDVLLDQGRAIAPDSPAEDLHDLRKDAKKLRYLLECFGSLLPTKRRKAFVNQLKALQDNLGIFQDLEVQIAELRDLARTLHRRSDTDTETLLATGRLIDHLEQARHRARDEFVERFAAYDTPANRATLADLLAEVEDA